MAVLELIWIYLVGPLVAAAQNSETATWAEATAQAGYNSVNTVVLAAVAISFIYGTYRLFQKYDIEFDTEKVIYSIPFIVLGGLLRFIEDTGAVSYPYSIILITPVIYMAMYVLYMATLVISLKIKKRYEIHENKTIFYTGLLLLVPPVLFTGYFFTALEPRFDLLLLALALPVIATATYKFIVKETGADRLEYHLIVFSQIFGGAASMVAVTQGYEQKQLLTQAFTQAFGAPGILIAKSILAALVIWALLDVDDKELEGLAVFVMLVVGLATGLRVLLRMLAGV